MFLFFVGWACFCGLLLWFELVVGGLYLLWSVWLAVLGWSCFGVLGFFVGWVVLLLWWFGLALWVGFALVA